MLKDKVEHIPAQQNKRRLLLILKEIIVPYCAITYSEQECIIINPYSKHI